MEEQPQTQTEKPQSGKDNFKKDDNNVFIGSKPFMNYVTSIAMQFQKNENTEVTVKARGKFISKAVDVVEIARKRFLEDQKIKIKNIKIDTEEYEKEGRKINVSTIDIILNK